MKRKNGRKVLVYSTPTSGKKYDYFEYWYRGEWKNQAYCEKWLAKHPGYQWGAFQLIRTSRAERFRDFLLSKTAEPMSVSAILEACKANKQAERESKPVELKPETAYTYNREIAEEWMGIAKENNWDLTVSIKPLCEHLGLAPVVVAPVLQRYGFIEKRKKLTPEEKEKTYKYSKEQAQAWWDIKLREALTIKQLGERVNVHFLQVGKALTHYGYLEKKVKPEKKKRGRK